MKSKKEPVVAQNNAQSLESNAVFKEMIEKEQSYNASLTLLEKALIIDVHITHDILRQLRKPISSLKEVSDKLLAQQAELFDPNTTESQHKELRIHRSQYLKLFGEVLKIYSPLHQKFLDEYKLNPELFKAIDLYLKTYGKGLGLEAHLIRPQQKGPHYVMLFGAARKNSSYFTENNLAEITQLEQLVDKNLQEMHKEKPPEPYYFGKYTISAVTAVTTLFATPTPSASARPVDPMHVVAMGSASNPRPLSEAEFTPIGDDSPTVTEDSSKIGIVP